ncbi:hypothetical protein CEP53_012339 [Fusarium sp. AF-6]|nr:hypothetical protein CEP53_012339 [Fusarium sp. AF-6]
MASRLSFWFGPKILCRAGINPDSPAPVDTYTNEKMRKAIIPVLKEGRNSIDSCMLDLIAADDHVDFQVFAMLHTDENYLRDGPQRHPRRRYHRNVLIGTGIRVVQMFLEVHGKLADPFELLVKFRQGNGGSIELLSTASSKHVKSCFLHFFSARDFALPLCRSANRSSSCVIQGTVTFLSWVKNMRRSGLSMFSVRKPVPAASSVQARMISHDPNYPAITSAYGLRNYKRRVRRVTLKTLLSQEVQGQLLQMGQTDYDQGLGRLENSRLTSVVLDSARRNLAATTITDEDGDTTGESHSVGDENQVVPPWHDDLPYVEAAKAFMQLILDNPTSEYRNLRRDSTPCPRCQEDDTTSQELKIACPYCEELGKKKTFFHVKALIRHIRYTKVGDAHDALKRADGWFDVGWDQHQEPKSRAFRKTSQRQRQVRMAALDVRYSRYEPILTPTPHETIPGPSPLVPGVGLKEVSGEEVLTPCLIPERLGSSAREGNVRGPVPIPGHLKSVVKHTRRGLRGQVLGSDISRD